MDVIAPQRARSMEECAHLQAKLGALEDIVESVNSYKPRPSDVIFTPSPKCGATWLQQTFHTLRTGGDMDFDDISRVVPWIEMTKIVGIDLEAPQKAEPRGFKSHRPYYTIPKGAKYVIAFRDPKDALVSLYNFMVGWWIEPGSISITEFSQHWIQRGSYFYHLISWWSQHHNPRVLLLSYEGMSANPAGYISRLASFSGIPADQALLDLAKERSSISYMLAHRDRFDEALVREVSEKRCGIPSGSETAKVRKGRIGGHKEELPPQVAAAVDAKWTELVAPITGFRDYATFDAAVRNLAGG